MNSFIYSLSIYCIPSTMLGSKDPEVNRTDKRIPPMERYPSGRRGEAENIKQTLYKTKTYRLWRLKLEEINRQAHSNWVQYFRSLARESLSEKMTFEEKLKGKREERSSQAAVRAPTWWRKATCRKLSERNGEGEGKHTMFASRTLRAGTQCLILQKQQEITREKKANLRTYCIETLGKRKICLSWSWLHSALTTA